MKFKLLYTLPIFILFFQGLPLMAQSSTSSPYSIFGIGEINQPGFGQSKGMGGTGIGMMSESSLNNINPASYQGLDSLSFLLEAGFTGRQSNFSDVQTTQIRNNATMNYLAIGFRGKSWWAGSFGLSPYSAIGNNINVLQPIEGTTDYTKVNFSGTGGLSKFYFSNSFRINKNLALGLNIAYLFGPINHIQTFPYTGTTSGSLYLYQVDKTYLSSLYLSYGLQYSFNINKNLKSTIGAIYANKQHVSLNHVIATLHNYDTIQTSKNHYSTYTFPTNYGVGISFKYLNRFVFAADYQTTKWNQAQSPSTDFQLNDATLPVTLANSIRLNTSDSYNAGFEILPSIKYNAEFWKTIKIRGGAYYSHTYLKIKGEQIIDQGFTVGLGIPILPKRLYGNVAFGMGYRGIPGTTQNIINETYKTLMFNFTLMDFWFVKRQYN